MLTQKLYNKLWFSNGKHMTVMSYVYIVAAVACIVSGSMAAGMLALVLAELSRVDKALKFLSLYDLDAIIYDCEHPEDADKGDDEDER